MEDVIIEDVIYDYEKRQVKRIPKPKGYQASPMGYIVHYQYTGGPDKLFQRFKLIYNYVFERLEYFEEHKKEPISSLEIEDIENQCEVMLRYFSKEKIKQQLQYALYFIRNECYTKNSGYTFIDDIPEQDYHAKDFYYTIYRQRYRIRRALETMYSQMERAKIRMEKELKDKKIIFGKQPYPENYIHAKNYITELIHQDIFRKEDLYDKVFKSTTYFGDYNKLYRKYKVFEDKVIQENLKLEEEEKELNEKQKALDTERKALAKKLKKKSKPKGVEEEQEALDEKQKVLDLEKEDYKKRYAKNKKFWISYEEYLEEQEKNK